MEVDARRLAELIRNNPEVREAVLDVIVGDRVSRVLLVRRLLREDLATRDDVTRLEERLDKLEERVARLEERIAKLEDRVSKLEERIAKLEERIVRLEERVAAMAKDVERLYSLYKTSLLAILISIFGTFIAQILLRVLGI